MIFDANGPMRHPFSRRSKRVANLRAELGTAHNRVQRLLAKAERCELKAAMADDKLAESNYYELAQQWRELAQEIKVFEERKRADKPSPVR
jgi:hypothetical protein